MLYYSPFFSSVFIALLLLFQTLDIYEFCTSEIQQILRRNRDLASKKFEEQLKFKQSAAAAGGDTTAGTTAAVAVPEAVSAAVVVANDSSSASAGAMDVADDDEAAALQAALAMSLSDDVVASASASSTSTTTTISSSSRTSTEVGGIVSAGLPAGWTGNYELYSIVTHKGRDADSGHYIGWVRQSPGSEFWWKYDDEKVSEVRTEEIMTLKGGGDKDMAYLVFYRAKI